MPIETPSALDPQLRLHYETYMQEALRLAELAAGEDEVPIGALVLRDETRLGEGYNRNIGSKDPTAHAEIVALRQACLYEDNYRLNQATIFVTVEPCPMCYAALVQARVDTIVYAAPDPKGGFTRFFQPPDLEQMNHQPQIISGILEEPCSERLKRFFREKRERGKRKWLKT